MVDFRVHMVVAVVVMAVGAKVIEEEVFRVHTVVLAAAEAAARGRTTAKVILENSLDTHHNL
jgi:hypothetical protein